MFLYWGSGSPPCWRVQLLLEEKGVKGYPNKLLSFEKKEHKSEEVLKLNPRGQVPTFRHGNVVINESLAIVDYLESVLGGKKLVPDDPAQKALVLQRKFEALNLHKKGGEDLIFYVRFNKPEERDQATIDKRKDAFLDELKVWEGYLEKLGGDSYIAGKDFSMADVIVFPHIALFVRLGVKLGERFPRLAAYFEKVKARPSVEATWPPHWKGTPNMDWLAFV